MKTLPRQNLPGILVGFEDSDDAAVFQLTTDISIVQTVDYFAPIVDDPFIYGQIAAANAVSDIYAMGGEPKTALSIVAFPSKDLPFDILGSIMRGGLDKLGEAQVALLGGHSVRDDEVKFGYAVTGTIDRKNIKQNSGARPGDRLILTKPLGTGLITTAIKRGRAQPNHIEGAIAVMLELNRRASQIAVQFHVSTMTDVTGFGLLGHAMEVARASGLSITIDHTRVPILQGVLDYSRAGFCAGGLTSNEQFFGTSVSISQSVTREWRNILFDPQTSGGLLIFCQEQDKDDVVRTLQNERITAVEIGFTTDAADRLLTVT